MKVVLVIDMQRDFIDMVLGTKEAQAIVSPMKEYLKKLDKNTYFVATQDTHGKEYMTTNEGKHLPVPHCILGTEGWKIHEDILNAVSFHQIIEKPNFGIPSDRWKAILKEVDVEEITLIGLCTDICVISNALALKSIYPEIPVKVIADLCAGVTPESHAAALKTMAMCQVDIL